MSVVSNGYAEAIGQDVYECVPKTVLAAIAVSLATCGGDRIDEARSALLREWQALWAAGIVSQRPPQRLLAEVSDAEVAE